MTDSSPKPPAGESGEEVFDFPATLRFAFDDPDWIKKLLIGGVFAFLSVILIGAFFVAGYLVSVIQRVARREPKPLPDWDDLGLLFTNGVRVVVVHFLYSLVAMLPVFAIVLMVLSFTGVAAFSPKEDAAAAAGAALSLTILVIYAFAALLMLVLMAYMPAALLRLAMSGRFGAAFEVGENIALIRRQLGPYVLALSAYLVASFIAQFGVLLCCVGAFPVSFWSALVLAHGLGQVARRETLA